MRKKAHLFFFLLSFISLTGYAQEIISNDSLTIGALFEIIQEKTDNKVYSDIDTQTLVPGTITQFVAHPDLLEESLSNLGFSVSVYGNTFFILKEKKINTTSALSGFLNSDKDYLPDLPVNPTSSIDYATSENMVYVIGDPYNESVPQKVILKGKITNAKTGEELIGVSISVKDTGLGTVSDHDGNFELALSSGKTQLDVSGFNIKNSRRQLMLYGSGTINIQLIEGTVDLGEVTVLGGRNNQVKNIQIGMEKLQVTRIKNIPTALGEVDILKAIQTLPGVKTVGEASTGFNVRGGATDQNLILFNDGTIYNPNHLFGFFSAFSSDLIKEAEIYKSSIPPRYGGRISSVLDLSGKDASKKEFVGNANIGLVTSKLTLEVPVIEDRTSVLLSGRTTYSDWILKQLPEESGYNEGTAGFYDLGINISHIINPKNLLNVYGYHSHDRFELTKNDKYVYNNLNASVKWRRIFRENFQGTFSAGYDHYDYGNETTANAYQAAELSFNIDQGFAKADFSINKENHFLDFGFKAQYYSILPGEYKPVSEESLVQHDKLQKEKALESAVYIGDEWEISPKFSLLAGIRYSMFNALGPRNYYEYHPDYLPDLSLIQDSVNAGNNKIFQTYHGPEFRISGRYLINNTLSVKAGFNSMRQYIHRLTNTLIMSPTDIWKLSDVNIKPQQGWQLASGLYYNSPNGIESSIELYYKKMSSYLDYKAGAELLMNHHIETETVSTEGKAYGIELSLKKLDGKLNGWVSYTYSRTFLKQDDKKIAIPVNGGDWYPATYDKPHDVKLVSNYKFTERFSLSVNVDYSTGRPTTVPAGQYYNPTLNSTQIYYTDRNSYRIPDYFRTDISFNIEPSHKLTLLTHSSVSLGVYNVTARKNIYSIYYVSEQGKIKGYQMSIFGSAIPYLTYNIKF